MGEHFLYNGKHALASTTTSPSTPSPTARCRCCCGARRAARPTRATSSTCTRGCSSAAVKLNDELGGGSLTALPIIETQASDISAYIPTNVISITDGQIFLESDLFYSGVRPAINVGISVSRVGGNAQTKAMKKVAGTAAPRPLPVPRAGGVRPVRLRARPRDPEEPRPRRAAWSRALNQNERNPLTVADQVASIYAGTGGYLDRIKTERVTEFLADLIARLHSENKDLMKQINETGQLSDEDEEALGKAIAEFVDDFGPDFDDEGQPLEAGESDRVKEEHAKPARSDAFRPTAILPVREGSKGGPAN